MLDRRNNFTAYIARSVPELGLALPAGAIGTDFLPGGAVFDAADGFEFKMSALELRAIGRLGIRF